METRSIQGDDPDESLAPASGSVVTGSAVHV